MMHARVEEYACGEDAEDKDRTFCHGNIKIDNFGVGVIAKTSPKTKQLTYAGLMMASPGLTGNNTQEMSAAFLILAARLMSSFNPDLPQEKQTKIIEKLIKGMNKEENEVKLGKWIYGCGNSILIAFSVESADDRLKH